MGIRLRELFQIVDQNLSVTASFSLIDYTLELFAGLGGSVTGAGIYEYGKSVSISANPNPGYYLENWTGATVADSTASTTTIFIDQNHSLRANFSRMQPILSITHGLGGTVSGGGSYDYDSNVSIITQLDHLRPPKPTGTNIHLTEDSNLTLLSRQIQHARFLRLILMKWSDEWEGGLILEMS